MDFRYFNFMHCPHLFCTLLLSSGIIFSKCKAINLHVANAKAIDNGKEKQSLEIQLSDLGEFIVI